MRNNASITVKQIISIYTIKSKDSAYTVLTTTNTTAHYVGEILTKAQVDTLITRGYKVIIK